MMNPYKKTRITKAKRAELEANREHRAMTRIAQEYTLMMQALHLGCTIKMIDGVVHAIDQEGNYMQHTNPNLT